MKQEVHKVSALTKWPTNNLLHRARRQINYDNDQEAAFYMTKIKNK
jgi:hypothetical protein